MKSEEFSVKRKWLRLGVIVFVFNDGELAQIAQAHKAESVQALATVHELIAEFGFTAQQVFPWKPQPKKVAAKYRDPATGQTWTGRGKAPKWIEGKDRTPFVIA